MNYIQGLKGAAARLAEHVAGAMEEREVDDVVEGLLLRISDGVMAEERQESMATLRDMLQDNPGAQLAFGHMGLPVMATVLREDRGDPELLRGALECLTLACTTSRSDPGLAGTGVGAVNAEQWACMPGGVDLLVGLLPGEDAGGCSDFFVKHAALQLLTVLLQASSIQRLQAAILASPMGVVRLMDMLREMEVLRNDALLLLISLTRSNTDIQKIAAFEGAFDHLAAVLAAEGGADGGIIVQDCLDLLNNLLLDNSANQLMFREMGHLASVPSFLLFSQQRSGFAALDMPAPDAPEEPAGGGKGLAAVTGLLQAAGAAAADSPEQPQAQRQHGSTGGPLGAQQAANLAAALDLVMGLIAPHAVPESSPRGPTADHGGGAEAAANGAGARPNLLSNCTVLLRHGVLDNLLALAALPADKDAGADGVVRAKALTCIGQLLQGPSPGIRDRMGSASIRCSRPAALAEPEELPALQVVLRIALHGRCAAERHAAEQLLRSFCQDNPDGQVSLVSTMAPMGAPGDAGCCTFGGELVAALVAPDCGPSDASLQARCCAAAVLSHLLQDNLACKERLLHLPLEIPRSASTPPALLMRNCMRWLSLALAPSHNAAAAPASAGSHVASAQLLRMLLTWLVDCPAAVAALLSDAANLPFLVDLVSGRSECANGCLRGLAGMLVGACILYNTAGGEEPSNKPPEAGPLPCPAATVLDVVVARIGMAAWLRAMDDLTATPEFLQAAEPPKLERPQPRAQGAAALQEQPPEAAAANGDGAAQQHSNPLDHEFARWARAFLPQAKAAAQAVYARPAQRPAGAAALGELVGQLAGSAEEQLPQVLAILQRTQASLEEAEARNRTLADDLCRMASAGGATPVPASASPQAAEAAAPPPGDGRLLSGRDYEALAAAEVRAGMLEAEKAALLQQIEAAKASQEPLQQQLEQERAAAQEVQERLARAEGDLAELSSAYNALEEHAYASESQARQLQQQLRNAAEAGFSEQEVQRRIDAAVAQAEAAAAAEAEDKEAEFGDLLVCLGQEEAKVAALSARLEELGQDVDALLHGVCADDSGGGEEVDDEGHDGGDAAEPSAASDQP